MTIPVVTQPDPEPPFERCCFCRRASPTWFEEKDVAVCIACAETHDPSEVPTKAEWCANEARDTMQAWIQIRSAISKADRG